MIDAASPAIPVIVGRRRIERDQEPTVGALRHAERTAYMELSRAYADLADTPPDDRDAMWNASRRVARHTAFWADASDAYFAALSAVAPRDRGSLA